MCLLLAGGERLHAIVTRESVRELNLAPSVGAQALISASWILVTHADGGLRTSARNRLCGTVRRIQHGAVNAEVVIELAGGNTLAAIITEASLDELGLNEGDPACALIKASNIILGVQT